MIFLAFSASGYSAKTTVRTVMEASVVKVSQARHIIHPQRDGDGQLIEFSVTGDGFLYNMVRIMAGTLVEVGFGKLRPQDIPDIIAGLDRRRAGRTAPAHGLYLSEVFIKRTDSHLIKFSGQTSSVDSFYFRWGKAVLLYVYTYEGLPHHTGEESWMKNY